jgi:hypothetical protein
MVGDLRVTGRVRAIDGTESLAIELIEGSRTYEFSIPGPAGDADAPGIRARDASSKNAQASELLAASRRLPSDRWIRFAVENLDDRLALEIDGEEVASMEIEPNHDQRTSITLVVRGAGAQLEELQVYRDIYYLADPDPEKAALATAPWVIPDDSYLMLGDNTLDSADSRDWKARRMYRRDDRALEDPQTARCNYRRGENPLEGEGRDGEPLYRFLDEYGEVSWLSRSEYGPGVEWSQPFVRGDLLLGRALAVFWPIKPHRGLWRLTWLH